MCISNSLSVHTLRPQNRYKILAAHELKDVSSPEKCAQIILDKIALDTEQYRMGKTKVHKYEGESLSKET